MDQLSSDLTYLNDAEVLTDGSDPLWQWLKNAHDLAGMVEEAEIFRHTREELERLPLGSRGAGWVVATPGPEHPLPQPARKLLNWPALPAGYEVEAAVPCNLAVRWGVDRGGFSGVTGGIPGLRLADALMTAELELQAALGREDSRITLQRRVWLTLPDGSTPVGSWPELARQALSTAGEQASPLLAELAERTAIAGFVLTWQVGRVAANEVINLLEGSCRMHQPGTGAPVAFCLELTGAPRETAALIDQASKRLLERGVTVDAFSQTWGPPTSATPPSLDSLCADLAARQLPEAPDLLHRLTAQIASDQIEQAGPGEIGLAVSYLRDQHPDLALSLVRVLGASPAGGTRMAALAAVADSDWLLDAWLAGIEQDFAAVPDPARLISAAMPASLRTSLVCALMRRRRGLGVQNALEPGHRSAAGYR